jgi:hypothetical protein
MHSTTMWTSCGIDEGRPLGIGFQEQVSNHSKLLRVKIFTRPAAQIQTCAEFRVTPLLPLDDHPSDICVQRDLLSIDRA